MSEKRYNLICSYLHMHRRAHFPHQVDDNHRYYDNAFTWVQSFRAKKEGCMHQFEKFATLFGHRLIFSCCGSLEWIVAGSNKSTY